MKSAVLVFLTQRDFADYLGISRHTLQNRLKGVSERKYKSTRRSEEGLLMVQCSGCKRYKFLPDFGARKDRPLGIHGRCRDCEAKRSREYKKKKAEIA